MSRLTVSIVIIGMILALGIFAIAYISAENDRLLGQIREVMTKYDSGEDIGNALDGLERAVYRHSKRLTVVVDDKKLDEIREVAGELRYHYQRGSEEFAALCHRITDLAEDLLRAEMPSIGRIL